METFVPKIGVFKGSSIGGVWIHYTHIKSSRANDGFPQILFETCKIMSVHMAIQEF
jgi:hypothetical protein